MLGFFRKKEKEIKQQEEITPYLQKLEESIKKLEEKISAIEKEKNFFIKKVAIKRYNPFSDIGGNQSFSAAMLNDNNSGIVITSLYTKNGSMIYGKPIKNGSSEYPLSEEEKDVIEEAIKNYDETTKSNQKSNRNETNTKKPSSGSDGSY